MPPLRRSGSRLWLERLAVAAVIAGAVLLNLWLADGRWGDPVVDTGRELDVPLQLASGRVLYRDVRYFYGPLAPYAGAALYGLFGARVDVLVAAGITIAIAVAGLVYAISRLFTGRAVSAGAAVLFLSTCAFGQYTDLNIFQFALPYSHAATYGLLVGLTSVYFLLRYVKTWRRPDLVVACLFLGLAALTKVEILFAVCCAHVLFLLGAWRLRRIRWRSTWGGYLIALAVPTAAYAGLSMVAGRKLLTDNLFPAAFATAREFILQRSGLADPIERGGALLLSSLGLGACLALVLTAAWLAPRLTARLPRVPRATLAPGLGLLAGAAAAPLLLRFDAYQILRGVPLLMLVAVLAAGTRLFCGRHGDALPALVLFGFALAATARVILRCGAEHYGFYLLVPAIPALTVLLAGTPVVMGPRRAGPETTIAVLAVLLTLAGMHAAQTRRVRTVMYGPGTPSRLGGPRGAMACPLRYLGAVDRAIDFLRERPEGTTVIVVPEGAPITFLAGQTNPLGVYTFLPIDFSGAYDDAAMTERVQKAAPDYLVWTSRPVTEYGSRGLGIDYGEEFTRSLLVRFRHVQDFVGPHFAVRLYERRSRADREPRTG